MNLNKVKFCVDWYHIQLVWYTNYCIKLEKLFIYYVDKG
ncbi:hypothetical protein Slin_2961 [Spirosoma linguale DSM 74]|uniref:Uncharacterized protein n=1 Tax=Spirosoma linguale (strain ATCC 33905 / DSM 74 / LMG 10896 / Claus 1) TaxID=504472 RepID=D2QKE7_SPILD|nr:hypothetical protein Slin_2961 [Spirosoma linguale DSM 74]